jgi:ABC-type cobalamin/Fe3+-siderophores transport system ATPase subunit
VTPAIVVAFGVLALGLIVVLVVALERAVRQPYCIPTRSAEDIEAQRAARAIETEMDIAGLRAQDLENLEIAEQQRVFVRRALKTTKADARTWAGRTAEPTLRQSSKVQA